jgi:hypothetical protein
MEKKNTVETFFKVKFRSSVDMKNNHERGGEVSSGPPPPGRPPS